MCVTALKMTIRTNAKMKPTVKDTNMQTSKTDAGKRNISGLRVAGS